jgi:hypothetical protein
VTATFSGDFVLDPLFPVTTYIGLQGVNWPNKLAVLGLDLDAARPLSVLDKTGMLMTAAHLPGGIFVNQLHEAFLVTAHHDLSSMELASEFLLHTVPLSMTDLPDMTALTSEEVLVCSLPATFIQMLQCSHRSRPPASSIDRFAFLSKTMLLPSTAPVSLALLSIVSHSTG